MMNAATEDEDGTITATELNLRNRREALVFETAENMAIYAGGEMDDQRYLEPAAQYVAQFEAIHGRLPNDFVELEEWALAAGRGHLFVVK
jgi:hypothetical protein